MLCNGSINASIALAVAFGLSLSGQDRRLEMPSSAITVSGCLQHATRSGSLERTPLGTTATPENAGAPLTPSAPTPGFLLTEATPAAPSKASEPAGRTETLPTPTATGTNGTLPTSYALDGNDVELAQHAGHRVEVTGTLAPPASPATGSSDKSSPMHSGVRRLQVTSIKQIATDCAPKTF
jgi:hypothetical protein